MTHLATFSNKTEVTYTLSCEVYTKNKIIQLNIYFTYYKKKITLKCLTQKLFSMLKTDKQALKNMMFSLAYF